MDLLVLIASTLLAIPLLAAFINQFIFLAGLAPSITQAAQEARARRCFTIMIPVKNEVKVIGRCLDVAMGLEYPRELVEVIVVDGRIDRRD